MTLHKSNRAWTVADAQANLPEALRVAEGLTDVSPRPDHGKRF